MSLSTTQGPVSENYQQVTDSITENLVDELSVTSLLQ